MNLPKVSVKINDRMVVGDKSSSRIALREQIKCVKIHSRSTRHHFYKGREHLSDERQLRRINKNIIEIGL